MVYILPLLLFAQNFDNTNQISSVFIRILLHIYNICVMKQGGIPDSIYYKKSLIWYNIMDKFMNIILKYKYNINIIIIVKFLSYLDKLLFKML